MYYLKNRYYDPEIRRFINADKYVIGTSNILPNLYVYCGNNPINNNDAGGLLFRRLLSAAKKAWNGIKKRVRKVYSTAKKWAKRNIGAKIKSSATTRYKTSIKGIGSVSYSHSKSVTTRNDEKTFMIYKNINTVNEYASEDIGNCETGIDLNIKNAHGCISLNSSSNSSFGATNSVGYKNRTYSVGVQWDAESYSVGITLGRSLAYSENVESTDEISINIGNGIILAAMGVLVAEGIGVAEAATVGGISIF